MTSERDLLDPPVEDPEEAPTSLSDWLRDLDLPQLAEIARAARLADESFGRYLRSGE